MQGGSRTLKTAGESERGTTTSAAEKVNVVKPNQIARTRPLRRLSDAALCILESCEKLHEETDENSELRRENTKFSTITNVLSKRPRDSLHNNHITSYQCSFSSFRRKSRERSIAKFCSRFCCIYHFTRRQAPISPHNVSTNSLSLSSFQSGFLFAISLSSLLFRRGNCGGGDKLS